MKRFFRVNDNLFRGGSPSIDDISKLKNNFNIKRIVSLDEESGKHISRVCKALDIEQIIISIDVSKNSTLSKLFKYNIIDLLKDNSPTFVHCLQGKDRTGLVIGIFRCTDSEYNWSCDKSFKEAKSFGFGTGLNEKTKSLYKKLISKSCNNDHKHIFDNDINDSNVPMVGISDNPTGLNKDFGIINNIVGYPLGEF